MVVAADREILGAEYIAARALDRAGDRSRPYIG